MENIKTKVIEWLNEDVTVKKRFIVMVDVVSVVLVVSIILGAIK